MGTLKIESNCGQITKVTVGEKSFHLKDGDSIITADHGRGIYFKAISKSQLDKDYLKMIEDRPQLDNFDASGGTYYCRVDKVFKDLE